ncbi:MAG: hypothetical protein J6T35_03330 [Bacteroidales bacterium]|nr:hypothetical protein [Bacteroidales bacterium]
MKIVRYCVLLSLSLLAGWALRAQPKALRIPFARTHDTSLGVDYGGAVLSSPTLYLLRLPRL